MRTPPPLRSLVPSLLLPGVLAAAGCAGAPADGPPGQPEPATVTRTLEAPGVAYVSVDTRSAALARTTIPGYAGIERLGHGSYRVSLTDSASLDEAVAHFRAQLDEPDARFELRLVKYDFAQLHDWERTLFEPGDLPAFFERDIDQRGNRIEVSVADGAAVEAYRARAREVGIPADAFMVRIGAPLQPEQAPDSESSGDVE